MKAFSKFNEINNLATEEDKLRAWLKDYEGLHFSIGRGGIDLLLWQKEKDKYIYSDALWNNWHIQDKVGNYYYASNINKIQRHKKRLVIEFDDDKKAESNLEKVEKFLKDNKFGYIKSSHKGKCSYLWIEFTKSLTSIEAKRFLKWIAPNNSLIDLNFSSDNRRFPILFAEHWKHNHRETPVYYYEGEQIDFDSLNISSSIIGYDIETKQSDGYIYSNFQKQETTSDIFSRIGQAEAFMKDNPIYYARKNQFFIWNKDKRYWEEEDETHILNLIRKNMKIDTITSKSKNEILESLKQVGRENKPEDIKPTWVQFKDKIYDIETSELFDASPRYFCANPIEWNIGENEDTPTIDKLFRSWVKEEDIDKLYEIIAFTIIPKYFIHSFFFLYGMPGTGKSTFVNLLSHFIGNHNKTTTSINRINSNPRFETKAWYRKLLVSISEVARYDELKNSDVINRATGEDTLKAEIKGGVDFDFVNYGLFICTANKLLKVDETDGFGRRVRVICFDNRFEKEKDVINEIPDYEFENLAKKSLRIAKEIWTRRRFSGDLSISERMKSYQLISKPQIEQFIDTHCDISDSEVMTPFDIFYTKYINYLKELNKEIPTKVRVSKELRKLLYEIRNHSWKIEENNLNQTTKYESKSTIFGIKIN